MEKNCGKKIHTELGMASQAIYQITLKGKLDEHWVDWFNEVTIQNDHLIKGSPYSILTCHAKDQAELLGILNKLNSLNLPLVQVTLLETGQKLKDT
jgi:hypothetical protein